MSSASQVKADSVPLCVDLDGTLIRTDMLFELLLIAVKSKPLLLFIIPLWLFQGKSYLKHRLAMHCQNAIPIVPFNADVLEYLHELQGVKPLVLVTGTHQAVAESVVAELNLFERVIGSTQTINLTGETKRLRLVEEYGEQCYDYIGNDENDFKVWASAREALAVSTPSGVIANRENQFKKIFLISDSRIKNALKLIRIHQWTKNFLIFVPLLLATGFPSVKDIVSVSIAFLAMSLLASFTYIVNDMLDLNADRQNNSKKSRPLASGTILLPDVCKLSVLLLSLLFLCTLVLPGWFNLLLVCYLVITFLYSFHLKSYPIIDVCVVASLLTMRVVGGKLVIDSEWSFWLLAYCIFLFFSLALAKRVSELINLGQQKLTHVVGRGYEVRDTGILTTLGMSSGLISVLVVALYFNSTKVVESYSNPMMLWLICPVLLYWVGRLWLICDRGKLVEDPIEFAIRDRVSLYSVGVLAVFLLLAKLT